MSKIKSLNEAILRLDSLMEQAQIQDEELKNYVRELHAEKQKLAQDLQKLRKSPTKADTTSSMHTKLIDALRE